MKTLKSLVLVGVLTVIGAAHTSAQNLIVNGDFTANAAAFTKVPGYALPAGSVAIADWVNVTGGGAGINGAATRIGNVFGPTTTGGRTYAFVAGGVNQLRQTLPITYSPDTVYKLSFDAAGRAGYTNVTFRVQIGDSTQIHVTTQVGAVELTGNPATFAHYNYTFTSPATFDGAPVLELYNLTVGDNAINFAKVSLVAVSLPKSGAGQGAEKSGRIGTQVVPITVLAKPYKDGRPAAKYRLDAVDQGRVMLHGDGPGECDKSGAREAIAFEWKGTYYLHYDGAGPQGWLACLATSQDLTNWTKQGPALTFGPKGSKDSGSASSPWVYNDGTWWHMFYVATPNTMPAPDLVPLMPYYTLKARSKSPSGPWEKQSDIIPFTTKPGTYYSATASPGPVVRNKDEYLMFFSACTPVISPKRTLGIARTKNLDGPWTLDPEPVVPLEEQLENASLYYEKDNQTWWLFTNHVGDDARGEYTDAIWVYWSKDLNHWDRDHKAIVLDGKNCSWSKGCIGLPSVVQVGKRLAVIYDAPGGWGVGHMNRDIGLAWLDLPLQPPTDSSLTPKASDK